VGQTNMKRFIFATILIVGGLFLSQQVFALTISPVRFEISGDPGQTLSGEIILFNGQDTTETFYSSFEKFEARGEGGEPHFIPVTEGLATWIKTDAQVTLKPGERKTIPFTIDIPQDAEPGGHFATIFWGTTPPEITEQGQVVIGAKVGTLILLTVSGEIREGGGILEFGTENKVFTSLPITFFYRFANDSNDRIKLDGEIEIRNIFGVRTVVLEANPVQGNVLPASIRKFEVEWEAQNNPEEKEKGFFATVGHQWRNFAFGMYTAELNLFWRDRTASANWRFFIIPWQLLSVIIVILAIIGFFGTIGIKRYNRWIIAKASKRKT